MRNPRNPFVPARESHGGRIALYALTFAIGAGGYVLVALVRVAIGGAL